MGKRVKDLPTKFRKTVERQLEEVRLLVRSRRAELDLTQEQMAEAVDLSIESMKAIETGRRLPSLPKLLHICAFLGVRISFKPD